MTAAAGALTPVSILGDTQRGWWQAQMDSANTTWKLWGNEVSRCCACRSMARRPSPRWIATGLVQSNAALAPLQAAMTTALVTDLTTAKGDGTYPTPAYASLKALLANAGISNAVFDAAIAPALNAQLPPVTLLDQYILTRINGTATTPSARA